MAKDAATEAQRTRYAARGKATRIKMSVVLAPHLARYVRSVAKRTGKSTSSVVEEILEDAIFGDPKPAIHKTEVTSAS